MKTNPAYAALAYRRTIIYNTLTFLRREYVGVDDDPKQMMICEDVFASDAQVPVEEVTNYIEELELEHYNLTIELKKFQFSQREDRHDQKRGQIKAKGHKGPR